MPRTTEQLRSDALRIWRAGVDAVRSDRLVCNAVQRDGGYLLIDEEPFELSAIRRIAVVGAGKAGVGMALGLEQALGPELLAAKNVTGWMNVPEDCIPGDERELPRRIHLHGARPGGRNEPTVEGVRGVEEILSIVHGLGPQDLCICLLSGGGSALLPAPIAGITLEDKLNITRFLSKAGANIHELNTVRKPLSRIKGGGLLRECRAVQLVTLIISDVIGDPLDVIASGPTVESRTSAADALDVLKRFRAGDAHIADNIIAKLEALMSHDARPRAASSAVATNIVIGNNAVAVDRAGLEAEHLGYSHAMIGADPREGAVEPTGRHLARVGLSMRDRSGPDCLISGGEGVVEITPGSAGKGGRNQQLVLAALQEIVASNGRGVLLLSGGTDGEDGPTDAAGAIVDDDIIRQAAAQGLEPMDYLRRNDAYHFFAPIGGLIKTGPTHTNVCDIRVLLVDREELQSLSRTK